MKILILTGKFGMGHIKAAEAIKEELIHCRAELDGARSPEGYIIRYARMGIHCRVSDIEIIDWIEYMTPLCAKYIYGSYSALIRRSTFFITFTINHRKTVQLLKKRTWPAIFV